MAMSKQITPASYLDRFMKWAHAAGYHVGEHPAYGGVTRGVHNARSWHYDGLAADVNKNGPRERAELIHAMTVATSFGLAVIFARDGVAGVARNHQGHLHVDVGEWSNYGDGDVRARSGDAKVWTLQGAVNMGGADRDNLYGPDTDKRLYALAAAAELGGRRHPYGVAFTQDVVGARTDGVWGPASAAAHDATVSAVQRVLGVAVDGRWGPVTDRAWKLVRKAYGR
jgi:hypothetical protein